MTSDQITVYADGSLFEPYQISSFNPLVVTLDENRRCLFECPVEVIIGLFDQLSRVCIRDPVLATVPGMPYLSLWLRRENLNHIYSVNFSCLDTTSQYRIFPMPRGIVCHWIPGNIPLLGIFSLVLATLGKNASILKVSPSLGSVISCLMNCLKECSVEINGCRYSGDIITNTVAVVSFPGKNPVISERFSLIADCRVVYGGNDAVKSISNLPHQVHCETIVYGPKYSFAICDADSVSSKDFSSILDGLARDVVLFSQAACSSPHVLFCENGSVSVREVASQLADAFDRIPDHLYTPLAESTLVSVINTRGRYLLSEQNDILCSSDLRWTICINQKLSLEEPVQGRCIFVKEVEDISQVLDLVTRKVQTVALCISDEKKRDEYAHELAYRGVDRVMRPGTMHEYTQPWDGILGVERMVRWVVEKT